MEARLKPNRLAASEHLTPRPSPIMDAKAALAGTLPCRAESESPRTLTAAAGSGSGSIRICAIGRFSAATEASPRRRRKRPCWRASAAVRPGPEAWGRKRRRGTSTASSSDPGRRACRPGIQPFPGLFFRIFAAECRPFGACSLNYENKGIYGTNHKIHQPCSMNFTGLLMQLSPLFGTDISQ